LIELILIIAILAITTALVVPRMADFFRGRTLDSESRQLLALMRHGQSRAVSDGIPVVLWLNDQESKYGLEQEPGYREEDAEALEFELDSSLRFEVSSDNPFRVSTGIEAPNKFAGMPHIRFLPDGTTAESSPRQVQLINDDGSRITLRFSEQRNQYELQSGNDE
jgi:Tfp pilus assembly protein FimT